MLVEYAASYYTSYREWVCFEHTGYARQKACSWSRLELWLLKPRGQIRPVIHPSVTLPELPEDAVLSGTGA